MTTATPTTSTSALIKAHAAELGFSLIGIAPATTNKKNADFYNWWTDQGYGAEMFYLRYQKEKRQSLEAILPGAKAAIVCALEFPRSATPAPKPAGPAGKVARYATIPEDYHERVKEKLEQLARFVDELHAGESKSLAYVDTGAIPERTLAQEAGLGWIGKNAMLINPEKGSWFWLGEVVTTAPLEPDAPTSASLDHCGKCRRCIDACPTGAILEDLRAVDSRKCISYLTIEHRGPIPSEFHKPTGEWLLGCDICQEVCPWNGHSEKLSQSAPQIEWLSLDEIATLSPEDFRQRYKKRAHARTKLAGLQRNAAIVRANLADSGKLS